jgi:hypothetical protein
LAQEALAQEALAPEISAPEILAASLAGEPVMFFPRTGFGPQVNAALRRN